MSGKKFFLFLLVFLVIGAFAALSYDQTEAAERPALVNNPPLCLPIPFTDEGHWGMACSDQDNNISSVVLITGSSHSLIWDNTQAQMIVAVDDTTTIKWQVCDSAGACVGGSY